MKYFPMKPAVVRNAREREHEDQQQDGGAGVAVIEAVEVVEFIADDAALAHHDDDGEGTDGHEGVGDEVIKNAHQTGFVPGDDAQQDVADMGDRRVSQQALDVGLRKSGQISPGKRSDGNSGDQVEPSRIVG